MTQPNYDLEIKAKLHNLTLIKRVGLFLIWLGAKLNGYEYGDSN